MQTRHQGTQWVGALAGALALHAAALWLLQHRPTTPLQVTAPHAAARVLHVNVVPGARPHPVIAPPMPAAPEPAAPPPTPAPAPRPADVQPAVLSAARRPEVLRMQNRVPIPKPAKPATSIASLEPTTPEIQTTPATTAPDQSLWLDAVEADSAPTPEGNRWILAEGAWPRGFTRVQLRVWVSAQGRIERFELEGPAAEDPAVLEFFAPLVDTPMQPARVGRVPVPSVMRMEIRLGKDGVPDFVAPLGPETPS